MSFRVILVVLFCAAAATGSVAALLWVMEPDGRVVPWGEPSRARRAVAHARTSNREQAASTEKAAEPAGFDINPDRFEDGGFGMAITFTGPVHDVTSLRELREAIRTARPQGNRRIQNANRRTSNRPPFAARADRPGWPALSSALA